MISKNYVSSIAILVSAVVGVGMFTLPYVGMKAGILTMIFYFLVLGGVQHWFHKLYAEIVLSTKKQHRLPGYAEKYLGIKSKRLLLVLTMFAGYGALLAYTIIGGDFLFQLLSPLFGGTVFFYTALLLALRSLVIFFGLSWVTRVEVILTGGLIGTMLIIGAVATDGAMASNITLFNPGNFMLPYGPIFFAVGGILAVNDICLVMKKEKQRIQSALRVGLIISISLIALFTITVMSLSGAQTSPDGLGGLRSFIDPLFYNVLLAVGIVTVTTSFFAMAEALEETYVWDFNINRRIAWLLVSTVPFILYYIGAQDVTKVIALTGAISGGLLGAFYLVLALRAKLKPELDSPIKVHLTPAIAYAATALLIIGLGYQLIEIFG